MLWSDPLKDAFGLLGPQHLLGILSLHPLEDVTILDLNFDPHEGLAILVVVSVAFRTLLDRLSQVVHGIETRL